MSQLIQRFPSAVVSAIAQGLCLVAERTGKKVEPMEAETWCRAFAGCDPDELRQAFDSLAMNSFFPPTIAGMHHELQRLRFGGVSGAWTMVQQAAVSSRSSYCFIVFEHPAIHFAIESIGGWFQLGRQIRDIERISFIRRDFTSAFEDYRPSLPHVAGMGSFNGTNAVLLGHRGRALEVYRSGVKRGRRSVPGMELLMSDTRYHNEPKDTEWPEQLEDKHLEKPHKPCNLPPRLPWESDEEYEARIVTDPSDNDL